MVGANLAGRLLALDEVRLEWGPSGWPQSIEDYQRVLRGAGKPPDEVPARRSRRIGAA